MTQPVAPAASDWQGIMAAAQARGFQFDGTVTDDSTALNFLLRQAQANRQADVHAQLGRQLAPHAAGIQTYLQQQRQPQVPSSRPSWEAPEFDQRWVGLVQQDPATGIFVGRPGCPPEIVAKVNEYVTWKENYDRNPAAVLNGMVEAKAKEIARQTVQETIQGQQRDASINSIVQANSAWMYQVDAAGQRVRDFQGNFVPTPLGARYVYHLQAVAASGVRDPAWQDHYAKELVRGEYARNAQRQSAAAVGQANPQTQQATAQPNINGLQALPVQQRQVTPGATEPSVTGQSLQEMIRLAMAAEGVTDSDIMASVGSS